MTYWSPTAVGRSPHDYALFPGGSWYDFQNAIFNIAFLIGIIRLTLIMPSHVCHSILLTIRQHFFSLWLGAIKGNKALRLTLPEPMMIQIYVGIWGYWQDELIAVILKMYSLIMTTDWGRDQMANVFKCIILNERYQFRLQFRWCFFLRVQWTITSIGSGNGLAPTRRQTIMRTTGCGWLIYCSFDSCKNLGSLPLRHNLGFVHGITNKTTTVLFVFLVCNAW